MNISNVKAEYTRLFTQWDDALKEENRVKGTGEWSADGREARHRGRCEEALDQFTRQLADVLVMMIQAKVQVSPNGDTALTMVLGEGALTAIERRFAAWQKQLDELGRTTDRLKQEVQGLKTQLLSQGEAK